MVFIVMRTILITLMFLLSMGCSTYRDSMQGDWELVEIRDDSGEKVYETCDGNGKCDIVQLSLKSDGAILVITAHDASGKEMKASYIIKEDGRLVNTSGSRPNMYLLDIDANKTVLIDREMNEAGREKILVFKKVEKQ